MIFYSIEFILCNFFKYRNLSIIIWIFARKNGWHFRDFLNFIETFSNFSHFSKGWNFFFYYLFIFSTKFDFLCVCCRKLKFIPKSYRRSNNNSSDSDEIQLHPGHRERLELERESGMFEIRRITDTHTHVFGGLSWAEFTLNTHAIFLNKKKLHNDKCHKCFPPQSDAGVDSDFGHFSLNCTHTEFVYLSTQSHEHFTSTVMATVSTNRTQFIELYREHASLPIQVLQSQWLKF